MLGGDEGKDPLEEYHVRKVIWLWGAILLFVGCASSPEVVMRGLPLAGDARRPDATIEAVSLQEAGLSGRGDRIFVTRMSLKNRTGKTLHFGPEDVYLADAGRTLLLRISERWLPKYYKERFWGAPSEAGREAISAPPSAKVNLGGSVYVSPVLTRTQRDQVAGEMAELVDEVFVNPQKEAPGTFMSKAPEVTLGVLVSDVTLGPGEGTSGYVYFYRQKADSPPYPLRLLIEVQGKVHSFLFRER